LNGHIDAVKLLVEAKADLWARNQAGNLAVFEAERAGKEDTVALLLRSGGTESEEIDGQAGHDAEKSDEKGGIEATTQAMTDTTIDDQAP